MSFSNLLNYSSSPCSSPLMEGSTVKDDIQLLTTPIGNFSIYSKGILFLSLRPCTTLQNYLFTQWISPSLASYLFKGKTFLQILTLSTVPDVYLITDEWRWGEREKTGEKRKRKEEGEKKLVNSLWRILFIKEKNKILKLWKPIIPMHSYDKITLMTPQFDHLKWPG